MYVSENIFILVCPGLVFVYHIFFLIWETEFWDRHKEDKEGNKETLEWLIQTLFKTSSVYEKWQKGFYPDFDFGLLPPRTGR